LPINYHPFYLIFFVFLIYLRLYLINLITHYL